ncbi:hypothetical protein JTE90_001495 [Oedothorax gibbosus]|uniref:Uncharacterized protein n=1 Tax=Oedothorax gibbosus TaxID=931172 RepID=A0AAV6UME7_9ARAC|nr:hypothetical protein JTE90_001495 [Oedothorax gibbosus]
MNFSIRHPDRSLPNGVLWAVTQPWLQITTPNLARAFPMANEAGLLKKISGLVITGFRTPVPPKEKPSHSFVCKVMMTLPLMARNTRGRDQENCMCVSPLVFVRVVLVLDEDFLVLVVSELVGWVLRLFFGLALEL